MKNNAFFITATNTDVGKTYACTQFLKYYAKQGYKVGYYKPIETGVQDTPLDGTKMLQLVKELNPTFEVSINDVVPYQFKLPAAPFVAKENTTIDIELLKQKKEYLLQFCDILIIEGAGGLMVPIEKDFFIIDLIQTFNVPAKLITPSRLGCINDTLLSIEALKNKKIDFEWYINLYEDKETFENVTLPYYEATFKQLKYVQDLL